MVNYMDRRFYRKVAETVVKAMESKVRGKALARTDFLVVALEVAEKIDQIHQQAIYKKIWKMDQAFEAQKDQKTLL